ncbi:hypothetical protein AYO21_10602 [Fonsecaea monophora]|uniref:Xylanolytic transcriptional activator regulatory domain-containing protein n=1 Tax=Fonsecaea monophora TaxID=254056 RepID=A0A177ET71_9EURO|nr:hypothetical protein AYO21_10602 [Fonsecaea monophora]OAG35204.1 hypothetical protein AYO21_10602 [Fonsecaea monophora]
MSGLQPWDISYTLPGPSLDNVPLDLDHSDMSAILSSEHGTMQQEDRPGPNDPQACQSEALPEDDLQLWSQENSSLEIELMRKRLETYFVVINPYYPCLNETQTLAQFENYLQMDEQEKLSFDSVQFVAMLHLISSLLAILEDSSSNSDDEIPGWTGFKRASHLLYHTAWLADGNLATIQTLIIKCTYLLYAEKYNATYDAVGQAVRLCFLIKLHTQSENDQYQSPFETHMRQRVFWALYCLERNVALVCGVPYLIRDSEIQVPLPSELDDQSLGNTEQVPDESPTYSFIPHLHCTSQWAQLSSQCWDHLFCASAKWPVDEDFIITMDARIEYLRNRVPQQLSWRKFAANKEHAGDSPPYMKRQAMILHLRCNHLRLQIRRENILTTEFRTRDVRNILDIATDSVDILHSFHFSPEFGLLSRYMCVTYITGALIAVGGVILGDKLDSSILIAATQTFRRAVDVLRSISVTLRLARSNLKKLERIIDATERIAQTHEVNLISDSLVTTFTSTQPRSSDTGLGDAGRLPDKDTTVPFDQGNIDDGPIRMMYTPAFDAHYWDSLILDL